VLILTERGEVRVELLEVGDRLLTRSKSFQSIRWIGRRLVRPAFGDPLRTLPIRIRAGALGENVPSRDLLLSPDHAIFIDEILVQAGALVNGTSIVRETHVPETFTYYHVELDDHSLIIAENTLVESFVDNTDRVAFDNWIEHENSFGDQTSIVELPYPRAKAHRQVPQAIRAQLARRARWLCEPRSIVA
jgi:hypothetical protein